MKGSDLLFESCRIFKTSGNNKITGKDPRVMVSQKPEVFNQTNDSLQ